MFPFQEVPHSDLVSLAGNSWVSCLVDYFSDRDFILTYRNQLASNLLLVFSTMNMLSYVGGLLTIVIQFSKLNFSYFWTDKNGKFVVL